MKHQISDIVFLVLFFAIVFDIYSYASSYIVTETDYVMIVKR